MGKNSKRVNRPPLPLPPWELDGVHPDHNVGFYEFEWSNYPVPYDTTCQRRDYQYFNNHEMRPLHTQHPSYKREGHLNRVLAIPQLTESTPPSIKHSPAMIQGPIAMKRPACTVLGDKATPKRTRFDQAPNSAVGQSIKVPASSSNQAGNRGSTVLVTTETNKNLSGKNNVISKSKDTPKTFPCENMNVAVKSKDEVISVKPDPNDAGLQRNTRGDCEVKSTRDVAKDANDGDTLKLEEEKSTEEIFENMATVSEEMFIGLEMAVEMIVYEMKEQFYLDDEFITRKLRPAVRTRLYTVMKGRRVEQPTVIQQVYRDHHNISTDPKLICDCYYQENNIAEAFRWMAESQQKSIEQGRTVIVASKEIPVESMRPSKHLSKTIKQKIQTALQNKFDVMFKKLTEFYEEVNKKNEENYSIKTPVITMEPNEDRNINIETTNPISSDNEKDNKNLAENASLHCNEQPTYAEANLNKVDDDPIEIIKRIQQAIPKSLINLALAVVMRSIENVKGSNKKNNGNDCIKTEFEVSKVVQTNKESNGTISVDAGEEFQTKEQGTEEIVKLKRKMVCKASRQKIRRKVKKMFLDSRKDLQPTICLTTSEMKDHELTALVIKAVSDYLPTLLMQYKHVLQEVIVQDSSWLEEIKKITIPLTVYLLIQGAPLLPSAETVAQFLKPYRPTKLLRHRADQVMVAAFESKEVFEKLLTRSHQAIGVRKVDFFRFSKTQYRNGINKNELVEIPLNLNAAEDSCDKINVSRERANEDTNNYEGERTNDTACKLDDARNYSNLNVIEAESFEMMMSNLDTEIDDILASFKDEDDTE